MINELEVEVVDEGEDNVTDYENDSEGESDVAETKVTNTDKGSESLEDKRARLQRQLDKVNKKLGVETEGKSKGESSESSSKSETSNLQERLDRQELKIAGITDKKEQAEVLNLAKKLELDIEDAVTHPAIKAVLKDMRNKAATPSSSTRTSSGSRDEVAYWASQTLRGNFAPTAEMRTKVREYLAKNK